MMGVMIWTLWLTAVLQKRWTATRRGMEPGVARFVGSRPNHLLVPRLPGGKNNQTHRCRASNARCTTTASPRTRGTSFRC